MQAEYEIYADVWFLTNFTMDAIALWSAGKLLRQPSPWGRVFLASLAGTGGSMLLFFQMHDPALYQLAVHFFVNPCMVWICCGTGEKGFAPKRGKEFTLKQGIGFVQGQGKGFLRKRQAGGKSAKEAPALDSGSRSKGNRALWIKSFLCRWAAVYLAVLLLGGFLEWAVPKGQGVLHILACLAGAVAAVEAAERLFLQVRHQRRTVCGLLLVTRETKVSAKGFWDTGNLLVDPMVNRPVHIARKSLLWEQIQKEGLPIRLIPFHSLGMEQGVIEAVTLEGMYILREGSPVYLDKPVFGIAEEKLFQDGRCDVILNGKSMEI